MFRVEQYKNRHHLAVREAAGAVAVSLAEGFYLMFFQLWSKKLAEFVENKEISIIFADYCMKSYLVEYMVVCAAHL
jgi:hypothetical protein